MKKITALFVPLLVSITFAANGQIELAKFLGNNASDVNLGYGAFLKFSHPVSDGNDVSLEIGANIFMLKSDNTNGWATVPVKIGFRYTLNQTGTGFYLEPQLGYNFLGVDPDGNNFKGLVYAATFGYLFNQTGWIRPDPGIHFESGLHTGGAVNFIALRMTQNFGIGRRDPGN